MTDTPLLQIEQLRISFGNDPPVLQDVSFSINRGESLALVGESGSGKTLTSLSIMQLLPSKAIVTNGRIWFQEGEKPAKDLLKYTQKELQELRGNKLSMIFQEPMTSLNPSMRCGLQVSELIMKHEQITEKEAKSRTLNLFEEVKLPRIRDMYSNYPHQLSGGQRQRVMIAMAMSCRPSLLIADEPTTALDVTVQKTILELLLQLREKYRMSLLFVTHDLGIVSEISDRIIVMHRGIIVEAGKTTSVLSSPEHAYTRGLIACRPPLTGKPYRLTTIDQFMEKSPAINPSKTSPKPSLERDSPILELRDLSTEFVTQRSLWGSTKKTLKAVNNISFEVYRGETLGIVGESGCGKTTLGRTILKLIEASSGEIRYRGEDISKLSTLAFRKFRKQIQIIFQNPFSSLNPKLTVGNALMEPLVSHKLLGSQQERRDRVIQLLKRVGLEEHHVDRYPHEFSGGQRQRIGIARALCVEPEIIICDESVSSLDVSVQAMVLNLLNDLKEEFSLTYLFISHDLAVVRYMSDRILVMNEGSLVETGLSDDLFHSPKSEITRILIESIPGFVRTNSEFLD
jgi:peptide/nickel transport system ATP-binding protein